MKSINKTHSRKGGIAMLVEFQRLIDLQSPEDLQWLADLKELQALRRQKKELRRKIRKVEVRNVIQL